MKINQLVEHLYKNGLGELFILHVFKDSPFFGKIVFEKEKLIIKDSKLLADIKVAQLEPCLNSGALGLITKVAGNPWESLTFFGLDQCKLPVDLSKTQHNVLIAAENQYGDNLVDFVGSVYRGYQLMLDNHFIPVVLLKSARNKDGVEGLIVTDLRAAPLPISLINSINNDVRKSIEKHLVMNIEESVSMDDDEFGEMFKDYLK